MNSKIYLVAENYDQAVLYARESKLKNWHYVSKSDQLRGIKNPNIRIVGTAERRKDFKEIMLIALSNSKAKISPPESKP